MQPHSWIYLIRVASSEESTAARRCRAPFCSVEPPVHQRMTPRTPWPWPFAASAVPPTMCGRELCAACARSAATTEHAVPGARGCALDVPGVVPDRRDDLKRLTPYTRHARGKVLHCWDDNPDL